MKGCNDEAKRDFALAYEGAYPPGGDRKSEKFQDASTGALISPAEFCRRYGFALLLDEEQGEFVEWWRENVTPRREAGTKTQTGVKVDDAEAQTGITQQQVSRSWMRK